MEVINNIPVRLDQEAVLKQLRLRRENKYIEKEVLPHVPDAWVDHSKTKVGYEINFTKYGNKKITLRYEEAQGYPASETVFSYDYLE